MDKKPLIGVCILAVVLLMVSSLSPVIGYQSVKSTINDSPLFQTRTQRATNQQRDSIAPQYLRMGEGNLWQIPFSDNGIEQLKRAIDVVKNMDEKTFARFTELCIQRAKRDTSGKDISPSSIGKALHILKTKSETILNAFLHRNDQMVSSSGLLTYCQFPGCIPFFIFMYIKEVLVVAFAIIYFHFISYCSDTYAPCTDISKMHDILGEQS